MWIRTHPLACGIKDVGLWFWSRNSVDAHVVGWHTWHTAISNFVSVVDVHSQNNELPRCQAFFGYTYSIFQAIPLHVCIRPGSENIKILCMGWSEVLPTIDSGFVLHKQYGSAFESYVFVAVHMYVWQQSHSCDASYTVIKWRYFIASWQEISSFMISDGWTSLYDVSSFATIMAQTQSTALVISGGHSGKQPTIAYTICVSVSECTWNTWRGYFTYE